MKQYRLEPVKLLTPLERGLNIDSSVKVVIFKGFGFYDNPIRCIWNLFINEEIFNKPR